MDWFRAYHGMPYDPLLGVAAKRAGTNQAGALGVWLALMDFASRNVPRGSLEGLDTEPVATALGLEPATVEAILDCFYAKGVITRENGLFAWEKLQPRPNDRLRRRKKDAGAAAPRFGRPHGGDEARAEALLLLRKRHQDRTEGDRI